MNFRRPRRDIGENKRKPPRVRFKKTPAALAYLTPAEWLKARTYQYHALQGTALDRFLNLYWWTGLASKIPSSIHPNLLTFAGFLCSTAATFLYIGRSTSPPRWIPLMAAVLMFMYQSLDAVDGKHARNLGISSSLGQVFDHGCDAVTSLCSTYLVFFATGRAGCNASAALGAVMMADLFIYNWYENRYGQFRSSTGDYAGVTEGQYLIIVLSLIAALKPSFYLIRVDGFLNMIWPFSEIMIGKWEMIDVIFIGCTSVLYATLAWDLWDLGIARPPKSCSLATRMRDFGIMCLHSVSTFQIIRSLARTHPFLSLGLIVVFNAPIAWKLILSSITRSVFRPMAWHGLPMFLLAIFFWLYPTTLELNINLSRLALAIGTVFSVWFVKVNLTALMEVVEMKSLFKVPSSAIIEFNKRMRSTPASHMKSSLRDGDMKKGDEDTMKKELIEEAPPISRSKETALLDDVENLRERLNVYYLHLRERLVDELDEYRNQIMSGWRHEVQRRATEVRHEMQQTLQDWSTATHQALVNPFRNMTNKIVNLTTVR